MGLYKHLAMICLPLAAIACVVGLAWELASWLFGL